MELVNGELVVTYTDGTSDNLGSIAGGDENTSIWEFELIDDNSYGVKAKEGFSLTNVTIPSEYNGKPVTKILENAFLHNSTMYSVTIPDSINEIGASAFRSCLRLKEVTIPDSVTKIGSYAFYECPLDKLELEYQGSWNLTGFYSGSFPYAYYYGEYSEQGTGVARPLYYADMKAALTQTVTVTTLKRGSSPSQIVITKDFDLYKCEWTRQ